MNFHIPPQFIKFVLVGLLNTAASLAIIFGGKALFLWNDLLANGAGYAVGLTISFFGNRRWTFDHKGAIHSTAARFLIAFVVAYAVNLATVFGLIEIAEANSYLAQGAGMVPYTVTFYLVSRYFVFAGTPRSGPTC